MAATENAQNKYKFVSSDNKSFDVTDAVIKQNDIMAAIYECGGKPDEEIPIQNVDGKTLKKVVLFCEKFVNDPPYNGNDQKERACLRADTRIITFFKDIKNNELLELVNAANYLNNQRLIDACLLHIHRNLEGLDVENIRQKLHVENDFSSEEEKAFKAPRNGFLASFHPVHFDPFDDIDMIPDFDGLNFN